jgi:uncharacterized protein (TIGR04552 family)
MSSDVGGLKRLEELTLMDLESTRLLLRGDSVVDWHRLHVRTVEEAQQILESHEFRPSEPADRARLEAIKNEAIAYLRRHFEFPIPSPVARASVEEILLLASGKGHRQLCACTILKAMHIIHHLDGRELLFCIPMSDQEVFHLVEEKVYRVIGGMLAAGFPITEFVGGRKNRDSLYTKLLSKADTTAAQIYDKLRFRIVTRTTDDILPVLLYLTEHLFPFSFVVPRQSINTVFHFRAFCERNAHLRTLLRGLQDEIGEASDELTPTDNKFSDESYRVIHFVAEIPVRLPAETMEMSPPAAWALGPIIFVLCEFQIVDRDTEAANELGNASHAKYKERQRQAVMRRLKLGVRATPDEGRRKSRSP